MPGRHNIAYIVPSFYELNCLHASSMDESGIVYSIDVVFLLHSRPDNFVESRHCQQSQPIQKLHQGVQLVTLDTGCIDQLSGAVHPYAATWTVHWVAVRAACARGIQHPFSSAKVAHDSSLIELTFRVPFILC